MVLVENARWGHQVELSGQNKQQQQLDAHRLNNSQANKNDSNSLLLVTMSNDKLNERLVQVMLGNYDQHISQNGSANRTARVYNTTVYMFVIISCLYGLISVISVLGNFLIILVVMKNKRMQNVTNYFICNLALADIVIGIFVLPFQVRIFFDEINMDAFC
jgi:hypothetical protein